MFLFVHLFFISCSVENKTDKEVVARVGNETLTKESLLFLVGKQANNKEVFSREVNNWVEKKLLYRAAVFAGLNKDRSLTKERDLFYENLLVSSFVKIKTKEKTKTTKKEVSDYYLKNKESFRRTDEEILVKHFLFSTKKEANNFKKEIKKKRPKKDMEEILKKQQVETKTLRKKEAGSNLVGFVFDGVIGEIIGPKKHNNKFHVFQILQKHKKNSYLGLEMVYDEIYHRLCKEKERLVLDEIIDSLYLNLDVFVSQEILYK